MRVLTHHFPLIILFSVCVVIPNNRDRLRAVAMDYLYSPAEKYQSLSTFTIIISEK
jgi:hypothetical protein